MSDILHDAHFHILDEDFYENKKFFIKKNNFQSLFLLNATKPKYWEHIIDFSKCNKGIIPFLGIHPWYVNDVQENYLSILEKHLNEFSFLGIGEIGLDHSSHCSSDNTDFHKQEKLFYDQLLLAIKYNRPISFHVIKRWDIFFNIIKKHLPKFFMIHGFSQSRELAKSILDLGGFISLGKKEILKENNHDTIRWLPIDKILIETDETIPLQEIASEKHYNNIHSIYNILTEIRGMDTHTLALNINNNIHNYLSLLNTQKRYKN